MKYKIILTVLLSMLFHIEGARCFANSQQEDIVQQMPVRVKKTAVNLYNRSGSDLTFRIGIKDSSMVSVTLKAGDSWSKAFSKDPRFKLTSKRGSIEYTLKRGKSYGLFWNSKKSRWDVQELAG